MIRILVAATAVLGLLETAPLAAQGAQMSAEQINHGGGCRKSSPPGQCCHMDRSTGRVHCH